MSMVMLRLMLTLKSPGLGRKSSARLRSCGPQFYISNVPNSPDRPSTHLE